MTDAEVMGTPWDEIPSVEVGVSYKFETRSGDEALDAAEPYAIATLDETVLLAAAGSQMLAHQLLNDPDERLQAAFLRCVKAFQADDLEGMGKAAIALGFRAMQTHAEVMISEGAPLGDPGPGDRVMFVISALILTLRSVHAAEMEAWQRFHPEPPI